MMGYMIWQAIKQAALDLRDETLLLMAFNIIWVIGIAPFVLFMYVSLGMEFYLIFWLIGIVLLTPLPFVTFAMFAIVFDIGQGKGIKLGTFFVYGWQALKLAYTWGGINLVIFTLLIINYQFYGGIEAAWGGAVQILFLAILLVWAMLQLVALAIYPRLEEPGFKLAVRNAVVVVARYPLLIFTLLGLIVIIGVISIFLQIIILLFTFSMIALLTNRMVEAAVKKELQRSLDSSNQGA
jgi:hypothetical protein